MTQDSNKALEEKARDLHQRLYDDDCWGTVSKCLRCDAILAVLREVAEEAKREERETLRELVEDAGLSAGDRDVLIALIDSRSRPARVSPSEGVW